MQVPLTIADHLERAALVYPERIGVVDEPDQPMPSWGSLTYRRVAELARAQAATLDELGVGRGERVAIVSHNAARLVVSFFGVSAWGRVLVPINFRLNAEEIAYIVEHSGATVLLIDPELDEALADIDCKHRYILGAETDALLWPADAGDPEPWDEPDENATATINYTSGTTARPKGVQMTHRNLWVNAAIFGWQTGVNDRDVYLHTLPMFHCNGWGMPYVVTGLGAKHVVLRQVDGAEILRRIDQH
ncbi:MAG TPA: AMP-binding protein, partial [Acidimicrobiales bacterium]